MKAAMKFERVCKGLYRGEHGVEILRISSTGARYSDWVVWVGKYQAPRYYAQLGVAKNAAQKAYSIARGFAAFTKEEK